MTGKEADSSDETEIELPQVKVIPPLKPGKTINKKRGIKKHIVGEPQEGKNTSSKAQASEIPDLQESDHDKLTKTKKHRGKKYAPTSGKAGVTDQTPQATGSPELIESDDEDFMLSDDYSDKDYKNGTETELKTIKF